MEFCLNDGRNAGDGETHRQSRTQFGTGGFRGVVPFSIVLYQEEGARSTVTQNGRLQNRREILKEEGERS